MATGFDDVTFDLISVQCHSLEAERAHRCHDFLARLGGTDNTAPQE